ncbi:MAG: hypothetical protein IPK56_10950 [Elusimicrobia bacterium]|nr:hypothetical protein [Elusimicrobiota bacterium]
MLLRFSPARAKRNFDRLVPGAGGKLIRLIWKTRLGLDFERGRRPSGAAFHRECLGAQGADVLPRLSPGLLRYLHADARPFVALRRLARRYPTALLSNTNPIHWAHICRAFPDLGRARYPWLPTF